MSSTNLIFFTDHEYSDSEESNTTTSGRRAPKVFPQKSYYSRFTYSSQSTPTRRYQYDGTKSTRSSSTASENKITFNEGMFFDFYAFFIVENIMDPEVNCSKTVMRDKYKDSRTTRTVDG